MSIDFSKAPEGATHYCESNGSFYRVVDGELYYMSIGGGWLTSEWEPHEMELTLIPTFEPFVSVEDAQPAGSKHDSGKPLMGAVPPHALLAVARVLAFGAAKYGRDNWQQVEGAEVRYLDATLRHINAHQRGEMVDPESGESHLAHAVCSLMFMLEMQEKGHASRVTDVEVMVADAVAAGEMETAIARASLRQQTRAKR